MSFYDDASWLLVPSGIEEDVVFAQKPISGLGDLTFTRASDATYTDASGVVRRSPYNLLQMSEMFADSYWLKTGSTITANATPAPNNTLTADKLVEDSLSSEHGFARVGAITTSGVYTFSAFVKAAERTRVALGNSSTGQYVIFDLSAGAVVQGSQGTVTNAAISSIDSNGFYRISCNITVSSASSVRVNLVSTGTTINYTGDGTSGIFIWGAQLVEGTEALDYFPTTNRQDVPRIDFRNADGTLSSCGRLLLEPQRTNLLTYSEQFENAVWGKGNGGVSLAPVVTENAELAPSGTMTADRIVFDLNGGTTSNDFSQLASAAFTYSSETRTQSIYLRTTDNTNKVFSFVSPTGTINTITVTPTYQRFVLTTTGAGAGSVRLRLRGAGEGTATFASIAAWGAQFEVGAYATSYIPTTTAAVTRLADSASKTGVSSLIGQTEGTLFFEFQFQPTSLNQSFAISDGTSANRLDIRLGSNIPAVSIITGGVIQAFIGSAVTMTQGQRVKVACGYKNNDVALYQNGALVGSTSSATIGGTLSRLGFDLNGGQFMNSPIAQAAIFPTRLTNAELAQLTTL